jgi:signal transduction histidine kinase
VRSARLFISSARLGEAVTLDRAAAIVFTAILFLGFGEVVPQLWLRLLLAVAVSAPLALRRYHPLVVLGVVLAAPIVVEAAARSTVSWPFLPAAFALSQVAFAYRRRTSFTTVCAVLGVVAAAGVAVRLAGRPGATDAVGICMMMVIAWGIGHTVRQQQVAAAERQEQAAQRAVAEERLRIARELHDVVAHSMSVIAVQASFGHYVIGSRPDEAATALGAIGTTTREVLTEMRLLLGVLRQGTPDTGGAELQPDEEDPLLPAPGLADLDRLVTRTADAGVLAEVTLRGTRRELPPGIDLSVYRIIQEALTNVVKHARTSRCQVALDYGDDELGIEITDHGAEDAVSAEVVPAGAGLGTHRGHGLIGMRERVNLYGGRFTAAPLPPRGFRVTARIPLRDTMP